MQTLDLNLPFKGKRNYLHGTSFYETVVDYMRVAEPASLTGKVKIALHRPANKQCRLIYPAPSWSIERQDNFIAEFIFKFETSHVTAWIEETKQPIIRRIPYHEELIIKKCHVKGLKIGIKGKVSFSSIEILVAMTKQLHIVAHPPEDRNWFFTRLDLNRLLNPEDTCRLKVELKRNLNNRLTRSDIFSGDERIGNIYFSLVNLWSLLKA